MSTIRARNHALTDGRDGGILLLLWLGSLPEQLVYDLREADGRVRELVSNGVIVPGTNRLGAL